MGLTCCPDGLTTTASLKCHCSRSSQGVSDAMVNPMDLSSLRACLCARAAAAASPSSHHLLHIFPYLLLHSCTNPSLKPHLASEWLFERSCYIYLVTFHILHANHALLPTVHQLPAPPLAAQECCCYREVLRLILHPYRMPTAWQEPTRKHIIFMILLQLKRLSLCHFLELQNQVCF